MMKQLYENVLGILESKQGADLKMQSLCSTCRFTKDDYLTGLIDDLKKEVDKISKNCCKDGMDFTDTVKQTLGLGETGGINSMIDMNKLSTCQQIKDYCTQCCGSAKPCWQVAAECCGWQKQPSSCATPNWQREGSARGWTPPR
jgi:hypothetical protein